MRIIGGALRGRPLHAPPGHAVRPTADRTRQALFNLLEHGKLTSTGARVAGATVLDAFAGTGALALEALSRGAEHATLIENDRTAVAAARANAEALGLAAATHILQADARRPPPAARPATLIFLDPPYGQGLAEQALAALQAAGWVAADALIAIETGSKEALQPVPGFAIQDHRRYGRAAVWLLTLE